MVHFLRSLITKWTFHNKALTRVRNILAYMDRTFIPNKDKIPIHELGINLWRDNVIHYSNIQTKLLNALGISKGRQGREAQNIVKVYLANLRLKEVGTDVLITAYEPMLINPLSESGSTVGAGFDVPAAQSGCMPMAEVFKLAVSSFKVNDWSLFGVAP
ncbi:unnamed protein product [Fraxinus pennsylvanica]|uniref:Cullin N-terminal domain-containing protein n=1 Tax=Fraxinus pennsylvanica TaxID=56036 RepID=A0AAD2DPS3_9LAMI|nr:unnamed protein product [Fraxinus pennsylvanica]